MRKTILLAAILLAACALPQPVRTASPVAEAGDGSRMPAEATLTPSGDLRGNCYYNWAYEELPELSAQVDAAIKAIQPQGSGRAQAFGENCIYEDGHSDFLAMETDFYVTLPVDDLQDKETLGNWIARGMAALESFPPGETPGPMPGKVTFIFEAMEQEKYLSVMIAEYNQLPAGLDGAALYNALFPNQ